MKILSWYIAKDYLKYWTLSLAAFVALVIVANLLGNLDDAFSSRGHFLTFLVETIRALPGIVDILFPMTVLLATVFTFTGLSRTSELVAMRTAGMGISRQLMPIFFVLIFVAALGYCNQNYFFRLAQQNATPDAEGVASHQWRGRGNTIYYLDRIDSATRQITGARIFQWTPEPFRLSRFDSMSRVSRIDNGPWLLSHVVTRQNRKGGWELEREPQIELQADDFPNLFLPAGLDAHHMPFIELYRKIRQLESEGQPVELYRIEWYQKIAALLSPFVLVWFGAPLSQTHHRVGRASGEIMISILGGLLYMVANEIFFTLGKGGFLDPFLSTWIVNLFFFLVGSTLMLRVR